MTPLEMLKVQVALPCGLVDSLAIVETGRRAWRCYRVITGPQPVLRDVTEIIALGIEARPPTRGLGAAPIKADFGAAIARQVAATVDSRIHAQIIGAAESEIGWFEP